MGATRHVEVMVPSFQRCRWVSGATVLVAFAGFIAACGEGTSRPSGAGTSGGGADATNSGGSSEGAGKSGTIGGSGGGNLAGMSPGQGGKAGATTGGASHSAGDGGRVGTGGGGTNAMAGVGSSGGGAVMAPDGWKLSWNDEFDGALGDKPDSTKWGYDLGGDGWGNNELEYYTDRPENAATDGQGHLLITLKSETYMNRSYTSARLLTLGKFSQTYGRFEARIKVPTGQGVWPAFWMLGADIKTNTWPGCGEIDIMEVAGGKPRVNHGSLHGPGYSGGSPLTGTFTLPSGALSDDFHLYAAEWETNVVRFYVDESLYETRKDTDVPGGGTWVYDHPFFMILNVAVGGSFGGVPDATTMLPQTMTVDYVRVYQRL
jgi:beta-glucanase (GH16 family)